MAKLHEVLAVITSIEGEAQKIMEETKKVFSDKPNLFVGETKSLEMFSDDRKVENRTDNQEITTTVNQKMDYTKKSFCKMVDALYQREATNQTIEAQADIILDDVTLAEKVPATALLMLEDKFKSLRTIIDSIPTLAPGISWSRDPTLPEDVYVIRDPKITFKEEKKVTFKLISEAIIKEGVGLPAQYKEMSNTECVGKYVSTLYSGMISPLEKSNMLRRCDDLIRAIKTARSRANNANAVTTKIATKLFDFIVKG